MKVKFLGESDPVMLLNGKIYEVLSIEEGWYRIIDEEGESGENPYDTTLPKGYLYPPELFEIVEE